MCMCGACMYAFVCVSTHVSINVCRGYRLNSGVFLHHFYLFFFETGSIIGLQLNSWLSSLASKPERSCCITKPRTGFTGVSHSSGFLCGCWRSKLRSSCLHSKHCTNQVISSGLRIIDCMGTMKKAMLSLVY